MKNVYRVLAVLIVCLLSLSVLADEPVSVEMGEGVATVTALEGDAFLVGKEGQIAGKLDVARKVPAGSRIKVGDRSRLELKLPDGSFVRFDAGSVFELKKLSADGERRIRDISVDMVMGKIWATVSRLFSANSRFDVAIKTTTAGVRGTVFRVNVNSDDSAVIKVYDGAVEVKGRSADASQEAATKAQGLAGRISSPHPVSGPVPVTGPHAVSMEEWVYTLKAMQQITIRPDGSASKPFSFSLLDDLNSWVKWNRQRDKDLGRPLPDVDKPAKEYDGGQNVDEDDPKEDNGGEPLVL